MATAKYDDWPCFLEIMRLESLNRSFLMSYPFNPLNPCSFIIFLWGKSKKDQEMFRNLETNY